MAEGLLPNSNSSRKKSKNKGFEVFHQHPSRLAPSSSSSRVHNVEYASSVRRQESYRTSDSDSSGRSTHGGSVSKSSVQLPQPLSLPFEFAQSAQDASLTGSRTSSDTVCPFVYTFFSQFYHHGTFFRLLNDYQILRVLIHT